MNYRDKDREAPYPWRRQTWYCTCEKIKRETGFEL